MHSPRKQRTNQMINQAAHHTITNNLSSATIYTFIGALVVCSASSVDAEENFPLFQGIHSQECARKSESFLKTSEIIFKMSDITQIISEIFHNSSHRPRSNPSSLFPYTLSKAFCSQIIRFMLLDLSNYFANSWISHQPSSQQAQIYNRTKHQNKSYDLSTFCQQSSVWMENSCFFRIFALKQFLFKMSRFRLLFSIFE